MKVWKVNSVKDIEKVELPSQPVSENCVKLKMFTSAITSSEKLIYHGKIAQKNLPLIIGRQGVGMVTELGEGETSFKRGDRVYIDPLSTCGHCNDCKNGNAAVCEHSFIYGKDEDGFMRDFVVVQNSDLYLLPPKVTDSEGVFIEDIAIAINALDSINIEKGEHLVIFGASVIGMILAQVALYYQAVPILVDNNVDMLEKATKLGIYYTINTSETDVKKKVFSITGGRMAETICYTLDSLDPVQKAMECCKIGGRLAIVGTDSNYVSLNANLMYALEHQLSIFTINNSGKNVSSAINMLSNKTVDVTPLIDKTIGFDNVGDELAGLDENDTNYMLTIVNLADEKNNL